MEHTAQKNNIILHTVIFLWWHFKLSWGNYSQVLIVANFVYLRKLNTCVKR